MKADHGNNFEDNPRKATYFRSSPMSESTEYPFIFPRKVEANIQKIIKNTGLTRHEVIQGLVMAFFDESDSPGENITAFTLMVKEALRVLNSGG